LNADTTWVIKAYGSKQFYFGPNGVNLGLGYQGTSGIPLSYIGYDSIYHQPLVYLVARGSAGRTPWVNDISLHVGYDYRFNKDTDLSLGADFFNLFNWQTATAQDQTYTLSNTYTLPVTNGQPSDIAGCNTNPTNPATCKLQVVNSGGTGAKPYVAYSPTASAINATANKNFLQPIGFQAPFEVRFALKLTF
jgi:hypothetical protein